MGCGCNKRRQTAAASSGSPARQASVITVTHEVLNEAGEVTASFTNPVTARAEARRIGGTVRSTTNPSVGQSAEITSTSTNQEG